MISFKAVYKPYLIATVAASFFMAIFRFFMMAGSYDRDNELYYTGAVMPTFFNITLFIFCAAAFTLFFFIKPTDNMPDKLPPANTAVGFTSALTGFFYISSSILVAYFFLPDAIKNASFDAGNSVKNTTGTFLVLMIITLVLSLPAAAYYIKVASNPHADNQTDKHPVSTQILSFFPIIWAVFYLVFMYFDKMVVLNNPERIILQLSVIMTMIYATCESRYIIGLPKPRFYFPLSLIALIVIISSCLPHILLAVSLKMSFSAHTIGCGVQLSLALYIMSRLFSFAKTESVFSADN